MMSSKHKWQEVEEKVDELRGLVDQAWQKGEWELAILGESTLRAVEQSKTAVELLKRRLG